MTLGKIHLLIHKREVPPQRQITPLEFQNGQRAGGQKVVADESLVRYDQLFNVGRLNQSDQMPAANHGTSHRGPHIFQYQLEVWNDNGENDSERIIATPLS